MKKLLLIGIAFLFCHHIVAQQAEVRGRVFNPVNNQGIPFANVLVLGTEIGTVTDESGNYILNNVPPGLYNIRASFVGYKSKTQFEIQLSLAKAVRLDFELEEEAADLSEVVVASEFTRSDETPLSVRRLNTNELNGIQEATGTSAK